MKALSYLKVSLYSALDGNTLYGSGVFLCIKSSIRTPIYASLLSIITGSSPFIFLAAFTPAINPWAAASSYPEVPFICPEKNKPEIFLFSKLG